jgi:molybdopterin molybdotransferase
MVGAAEHGSSSASVNEHLSRVLGAVRPIAPVRLPLHQALGRTLAVAAFARVDVPGFDNSSMDGYAVRHADVTRAWGTGAATLRVVGDLPAGSAANPALGAGEAVRIMTGAALPDDADSVVPVEETDVEGDTVRILTAPKPGDYVRRAGSDIRSGDQVLPAGRRLGATDLAAAAAAGLSELAVHPAPRVGILSTGDELQPLGAELGRGQIHDSNSLLLAAAVEEAGGVPVRAEAVGDDPEVFLATLSHLAPDVDTFVTSGGVSVGAYDVVKAALAPTGVWFGPVRMQPGKPQGFGAWRDGTPIFALPGNPVSVFVSFEAFVRPALLALQGRTDVRRHLRRATAVGGWSSPMGRAQYMPAVFGESASGPTVRPASSGGSGSHLVTSLARANCLAIVPEDTTTVREGDTLDVLLFEETDDATRRP